MQKQGLSQEGLKIIACITMLIDHIGATFVLNAYYQATGTARMEILELYRTFRIIGRLAFPIYCFLLVEGSFHTRDPRRYAIRLLTGVLLAELPFDLAFYGRITLEHQSVMITLLLGFIMLQVMKKCPDPLMKLLLIVPFALAAEGLHTDYGWKGIAVIAVFAFTHEMPYKYIWQFFALWCIFSPDHLMMFNWLNGFQYQIQELCVFAVVPIALYDEHELTKSKLIQRIFYLFYPVHLALLYLISKI